MQRQTVQVQTRADYNTFVAHLYHLSINIGLASACRALGINVERGKKIAQRRGFNISKVREGRGQFPAPVPTSPFAIEATNQVVQHYGDRAKISATIAGAKAMEHLADSPADQLVKPGNSIAADQWTKAVDRAAGWTQSRAAGANVAVQVNITPPSEAERAERRSVHAKLDEITRALAR
jgi:hypothetical protein